MRTRIVIGCMTGTSIDAADAARVRVCGDGLHMRVEVEACATRSLGSLAAHLRAFSSGQPATACEITRMARELAEIHVELIREVVPPAAFHVPGRCAHGIDLIAVHGQTVFHAPPLSWQLINAAPITAAFAVPVLFDLRAADLASGGQGAPITPLADFVLYRHFAEARYVVNLGGFCNVTYLPPVPADGDPVPFLTAIHGGDVCTCNHLLDAIARTRMQSAYDDGGRRALSGAVLPEPLEALSELLGCQSSANRSLGSGDESWEWVQRYAAAASAEDIAATAVEAIAGIIIDRCGRFGRTRVQRRLILAGGGVKNAALVGAIRRIVAETASHSGDSPCEVSLSDDFGVPATHREAVCMAVLGALCHDGVAITLPQVSRVPPPAPRAGVWSYP